ncbi:hypothetical protein B6D60_02820 [candidate division KSB1 bacterium 4484_87]|nr:MAG: hypothetical protein B6D60_02820 [candidate division KSB1 bacterium 4484_87]
MRTKLRRNYFTFFIILLVLFSFCGRRNDPNILARVGDEIIDREDFILNYELQAKPGARPRTYNDRKRFLQRMIENRLLALYGLENGYADDPRISHQLKAIEKNVLIKEFYRQKVAGKVKISDAELRQGFLKSKMKIRARHLFVKTKEQADSLLSLLQKGYSFQQLSRNLFRDTTLAKSGGDLGYFSFGDMDENFEDAAYKLRVGEISRPVKTRWGYHIIRVEDKVASPILSESEFQAQKHRIERVIRERKETALANEYVRNLMKDKHVIVKADAVNFLVRAARKIKKRTDALLPDKFPELTDEEIQSVQKDVENHLHDTVVEFAGGSWNVETFFQKIAESLPQDRPDLTSHLDIAEKLAVMVRNEFLLKEALAAEVNQIPHVRRQIRKQKMRLLAKLVRADIVQNIHPTEQDFQNYYQSHREKYSSPGKIHLREIVVADSMLAQRIYAKVLAGGDFAALAKEYSMHRETAEKGGDLGILTAPDHPQIAAQVKYLQLGQVAEPFANDGYYFLLQLIDRIPPQPLPFRDVEDLVKTDTKNDFIRKSIAKICSDMEKRYPVNVFEDGLRKIDAQDGDNVVEMIRVKN